MEKNEKESFEAMRFGSAEETDALAVKAALAYDGSALRRFSSPSFGVGYAAALRDFRNAMTDEDLASFVRGHVFWQYGPERQMDREDAEKMLRIADAFSEVRKSLEDVLRENDWEDVGD